MAVGSARIRPYRRLRRWARHTPNGTIAMNLITAGLALVLLAGFLVFVTAR